MSIFARRIATFILLLTVPLRVYAAVAMMFCGVPSGGTAFESTVAAPHELQLAHLAHQQAMSHLLPDHDHAISDLRVPGGTDAASLHHPVSCTECCCAGMIATASFDWKPQVFPAPAISSSIAAAAPSTVPHRLERPPRAIFV